MYHFCVNCKDNGRMRKSQPAVLAKPALADRTNGPGSLLVPAYCRCYNTTMSNHAEIIRQGVRQRAAEIESDLTQWIGENTGPGDKAAIAVALLRMGVNGHIGIMGEVEAFVMLRDMFTASLAMAIGATNVASDAAFPGKPAGWPAAPQFPVRTSSCRFAFMRKRCSRPSFTAGRSGSM